MGNSSGYNVIWYLDRENRLYNAGEKITGHAYICNRNITMLRRTVYLSYTISVNENKSTIGSSSNAHRNWIYSKTKAQTTIIQNEQDGKDLDLYTAKIKIAVLIPNDLPPSIYDNNGLPLVVHALQLSIDGRLDKSLNDLKTMVICVHPRIDLNSLPVNGITETNYTGKLINFSFKLNRNIISKGNSITIHFTIINDKEYLINTVFFEMIQIYNVEGDTDEKVIFIVNATSVQKSNESYLSGKINLTFPDNDLPPTSNYIGGINKKYFISVRYVIRGTVSVRSLIRNNSIEVEVPVFLTNQNENIIDQFDEQRNDNVNERIGFSKFNLSYQGLDDKPAVTKNSIILRSSHHSPSHNESIIGWNLRDSDETCDDSRIFNFDTNSSSTNRSSKFNNTSKIQNIGFAANSLGKKINNGIGFIKHVINDRNINNTFVSHDLSLSSCVENEYSSMNSESTLDTAKPRDIIDGNFEL